MALAVFVVAVFVARELRGLPARPRRVEVGIRAPRRREHHGDANGDAEQLRDQFAYVATRS